MPAVKKIRGVPRIERKGFKARKGHEPCGRPFPSVSYQAAHPKRAVSRGVRIHACWIPFLKTKVSVTAGRAGTTPRIQPFGTIRYSECGAMKLRFSGQ